MSVVQFRQFKRRRPDGSGAEDDSVPPVLVAASRVNIKDDRERLVLETVLATNRAKSQAAWEHYDNIGELHYGIGTSARICGHAALVPKRRLKNGEIGGRITDRNINAVVGGLWSPLGGTRHLIESFVRIRKLTAHAHLLRNRNPDGSPNGYDWVSDDELNVEDGKILRTTLPIASNVSKDDRKALTVIVADEDYMGRVWIPHPRYSELPDSPMGPIDNVCKILDLLTQTVIARLYSRLAMAGILYVPAEVSEVIATTQTDARTGKQPFSKDAVLNALTAGFMANMKRHDVAASAMPVMLRGPAQYAEALRLIQTDREIWETDMALREEAQNRMLLGLDLTPTSVKGESDSNHWSSWSNRDQELRVNVVPELEIFAFAMEVLAAVPELSARGTAQDKIDSFALSFDLSGATARPNLAEDARQTFDRGGLSPAGQRALSGIAEEFAPTDAEFVRWLGTKISDPYLATFGLPIADDIDWERVVAQPPPGPDPMNPGEDPSVGPGVGDPGSPDGGDSDTPKSKRPAA